MLKDCSIISVKPHCFVVVINRHSIRKIQLREDIKIFNIDVSK